MTANDERTDDVKLVERKSDNSSKSPASRTESYESDLPIDKGYAWVIVFGCFSTFVICLGLQRAYGILFVEFLHLYGMPVGVMSLVMSIQGICTSVSSLLTQTIMLSLLSERQAIMAGAVCGGAGIILSYFASNIALLILTQSVLVGSSIGLIMGPVQLIVSKYFHKRRAFAMACATLGGNVGSMVMPLFTEFLLERYGVKGSLLILGAFYLNILVFAGLLRPLHQNRPRKKKKETTTEEREALRASAGDHDDDGDNHLHPPLGHRRVEDGKEPGLHTPRRLSLSSHMWASMPDIALVADINLDNDSSSDDDDDDDNDDNNQQQYAKSKGGGSGGGGGDNDDKNEQELQPLNNNSASSAQAEEESETNTRRLDLNGGTGDNSNNADNNKSSAENRSSEEKPVITITNTTETPKKKHKKKKGLCSKFLSFFDFSLFKQPPFLLIMASCPLAYMPASLYGMYLPALAADKGVEGQRAALLLTVFGGVGIFARLGFGYLADQNCIRRSYLTALLLSLSFTAGLFTPLYNSYPLLVFFSVTYGLFGIIFFSLMPVVVVDLMGLHNMSKTLGFVQLFQGVVLAVSHPIIGHLRDVTGEFHASYYFMSAAGLLCAFLLLFTPCVTPRPSPSSPTQQI